VFEDAPMHSDDLPACHDYVREAIAALGGRHNAHPVPAFLSRSASGPCSGGWRDCARPEIAGLTLRLHLGDDARIREESAFLDTLLDDVEDPTAILVEAILAGCLETGALPVFRDLYRRVLDWARGSDVAKDTALVRGYFAEHLANAGDVDGAVAALHALRALAVLPAGSVPRDIGRAIADADGSVHDTWLAKRAYP